jgi:hypothetical protein
MTLQFDDAPDGGSRSFTSDKDAEEFLRLRLYAMLADIEQAIRKDDYAAIQRGATRLLEAIGNVLEGKN